MTLPLDTNSNDQSNPSSRQIEQNERIRKAHPASSRGRSPERENIPVAREAILNKPDWMTQKKDLKLRIPPIRPSSLDSNFGGTALLGKPPKPLPKRPEPKSQAENIQEKAALNTLKPLPIPQKNTPPSEPKDLSSTEMTKTEDMSAKQKFKSKLTPEEYKEFKQEMRVLEKFVNRNQEAHFSKEDLKRIYPDNKYIQKLKADGVQYGLTVTKQGKIYINVPASQFAQGGEKAVSFAVRLDSSHSILRTHKIKSSQISVYGESKARKTYDNEEERLDQREAALSNISGDLKVKNAPFKDNKHILIPKTVTLFETDKATQNESTTGAFQTGSLTSYCDGGDLRDAFFDLATKEGFKEFKKTARNMLKPIREFHEVELFHRDIKPENYMIKNDVIMLGDHGLVVNHEDLALNQPFYLLSEACNKQLDSLEQNANSIGLHQDPGIREKYEKMRNLINDSPVTTNSKNKEQRELGWDTANAVFEYQIAISEYQKLNPGAATAVSKQINLLNLFVSPFKSKLQEFHKPGTLAYSPPECPAFGSSLTEFQLTQPEEAAKARDLYSYGMSLFQMTHPISNEAISNRFAHEVREKAKSLEIKVDDSLKTGNIIMLINKKEREITIKRLMGMIEHTPALKDMELTPEILGKKSNKELNDIYKLASPEKAPITDFKEMKEGIKLLILPEMAKEFVTYSKDNPPLEGSPDEIILKLLSTDAQQRGTVKEIFKMLDKLEFPD